MLRKSSFRLNSLYFSSIGYKQSLLIFLEIILSPFKDVKELRRELHRNYSKFFYGNDAFSYSSARSSLYACLRAAGIKEGDEVLLTSFTCLAVPTAVVALGASPRYCDIEPFTLDIDIDSLKQKITTKTKAIILQHTLGITSNVSEIKEIIKGKEIILIEDCALSMGSTNEGTLLGSMGDASIFSLELSKTLSSGWGGILIVNDRRLAKAVAKEYKLIGELNYFKSLRMAIQSGISGILYHPNIYPLGKYLVYFLFKARFFKPSSPSSQENGIIEDDFLTKLPKQLLSISNYQILRFDEIRSKHKENSIVLREKLQDLNYKVLGNYDHESDSISPRIPLLVQDRDFFIDYFLKRGVEIGQWFDGPLSPNPKSNIFQYNVNQYPKASFIAKHIVNIPCHFRLSKKDINLIKISLSKFAEEFPAHLDIQKISQHSL